MENLNEKKVNENNEKSYISLRHLDKIYPNNVQAVFDFNLEIKEKEFIVFVGPSGCGKSTTLRMIAGLEDITNGELYIDGVYANNLEPKDRDVAMVFQSYALYPHMTVYNNLAFGLEVKHVPKKEIERRINEVAKKLQIDEYLDRKPKALSGGQCQRVALGRAIVRNAKVFLMDEPLSNLDAKLRVQMRSEIVKLHNDLGATTVYVTHDQTEAMTMASRIVVMKKGYIQQIGEPKEIYDHPANTFVATFIGSPAMNLLNATYNNGKIVFENGFEVILSKEQINKYEEFYKTKLEEDIDENLKEKYKSYLETKVHPIIFGIRPEDALIVSKDENSIEVEISVAELLGNDYHLHLDFASENLIVKTYAEKIYHPHDRVNVGFKLHKLHLFDKESGLYIL